MCTRENNQIQHALNAGEMQIGPFTVDDHQENAAGDKIVYEFHGCFWHGCSKCFARNTTNPVTDCSMADLYQRTIDKRKYLEENGYKYIYMWECEFDRQCKESRQLQNYIEPLEIVTPLEPRDAFYGGRTEVFTLYKEAGIDETIKYYEVTSLLVVSFYKQDRKNSARPSNDYHRKLQRYRSLRRINKMQDNSSKKFTHSSFTDKNKRQTHVYSLQNMH